MKKLREPKPYKFVRHAPEIDEGNRRVEGLDEGTSLFLESTVLSREVLAGREFYTVTMRDVRLEQCDLANLRTRSLTLVRVEFLNCRMTGWSGGEAECRDVLISGGDQRYCTFRYSKFQSSEFDVCNFEEADFQETDLTGAIFRSCNLKNVEMQRVKLTNADLRGSVVDGMHVSPESLRGATVDPAQAMVFAQLLGIRIL